MHALTLWRFFLRGQDGFGLSLDVVMKEGYGPGAGIVQYTPPGHGTPSSFRAYPMTFATIWSMPDPHKKGSALVLRDAMYLLRSALV